MIILNSLKSITVITATVVLSYFIWNKIVAWEKTAKCGAADFPHFTEMCLTWKLCPALQRPWARVPCDSDPADGSPVMEQTQHRNKAQLSAWEPAQQDRAEEAAWEPVSLDSKLHWARTALHNHLTYSLPRPSARAQCKQDKLSHHWSPKQKIPLQRNFSILQRLSEVYLA